MSADYYRMSPEDVKQLVLSMGKSPDIEQLMDEYGIDQAARIYKGDRDWLVATSGLNGDARGVTLSHAVHSLVLKIESENMAA